MLRSRRQNKFRLPTAPLISIVQAIHTLVNSFLVAQNERSVAVRNVFVDPKLQSVFDSAGFVVLPLLAASEASALRKEVRSLETSVRSRAFSASLMSDDRRYRQYVNALIAESVFTRMAPFLDDYEFCYANVFAKNPRQPRASFVPLHQDPTFVDETRFIAVNSWMALEDVNAHNGCLKVIPGSHKVNSLVRGQVPIYPYGDTVINMELNYAEDIDIPAGFACVMDLRLFHGSHGNASNDERFAASAVSLPREAEPLYCVFDDGGKSTKVYNVPRDFHKTNHFGSAPTVGMEPSATVPNIASPVTSTMLKAFYEDSGAARGRWREILAETQA